MYYFRLLGSLEITLEGQAVPLPPRRTHSLLVALLLYPRRHRRQRLTAMLTPDLERSAGRRRLSDRLWLLRQSLPALPVERGADHLYLPRADRRLDTEIFAELAAGNCLACWQEALALYRGPLLADLYADWLLAEREALYLQYLQLLLQACNALCRQQRFDSARPYAEKLVQAEPYDERALRTLMRIYRAVGQRGAALESYERFVSLAASELSVDPEPATQSLALAIRAPASVSSTTRSGQAVTGSRESLLEQGRQALLQGDRAAVEACIRRLSQEGEEKEVRRLQTDLALRFDAYDKATALLPACDYRGAALKIRKARLALGRRQATAALALAEEALLAAHRQEAETDEVEALLIIARAERQMGQSAQAMRIAERALKLARRSASTPNAVEALVLMGSLQIQQGCYERATRRLYEARSLALEYDLPYHLALALRGIGQILCHQQRFAEAQATTRKELRICRDLGLRRQEASALEGMALILDLRGRSADSLRLLAQAQILSEELGDPVRLATNQYHRACSLLYLDDGLAAEAITAADEAAATFRAHGQPLREAAALTIAGYARWLAGKPESAISQLEAAEAVARSGGELARLPELLAYRGLAELDRGDVETALHLTNRALLALAQGGVSEEVVHEIYYARGMTLFASGEVDQGRAFLQRAYEQLLKGAAQLEDDPAREAFCRHNPTTRRLMQELYNCGLVPLPSEGVITRWLPATGDGRPLPVRWTVDAGPADTALEQAAGAVALRHARLERLLREAKAQGATPTVAQLAAALAVSKRTVQRDLAHLRAAD